METSILLEGAGPAELGPDLELPDEGINHVGVHEAPLQPASKKLGPSPGFTSTTNNKQQVTNKEVTITSNDQHIASKKPANKQQITKE